jgi:hypothetical protein
VEATHAPPILLLQAAQLARSALALSDEAVVGALQQAELLTTLIALLPASRYAAQTARARVDLCDPASLIVAPQTAALHPLQPLALADTQAWAEAAARPAASTRSTAMRLLRELTAGARHVRAHLVASADLVGVLLSLLADPLRDAATRPLPEPRLGFDAAGETDMELAPNTAEDAGLGDEDGYEWDEEAMSAAAAEFLAEIVRDEPEHGCV